LYQLLQIHLGRQADPHTENHGDFIRKRLARPSFQTLPEHSFFGQV
jgi:hypothetical protein